MHKRRDKISQNSEDDEGRAFGEKKIYISFMARRFRCKREMDEDGGHAYICLFLFSTYIALKNASRQRIVMYTACILYNTYIQIYTVTFS